MESSLLITLIIMFSTTAIPSCYFYKKQQLTLVARVFAQTKSRIKPHAKNP